MQDILNQVLKEIKPSKKEQEAVNKIVKEVLSKIKIKGAKAVLGGSGAKGTWLKNSYDIDIYVKFNYNNFKEKNISSILELNLKKHFNIEKLHGSRDYFQVKKQGFTIEIVPILEIKKADQAKNITDISQLHVEWVRNNSNDKLRDNIRLAKAFCKAQNCYGAESYIKGFSGYSLEILTIKYKTFNNLLKNIVNWKQKEIIGNKDFYKKLNISKKQSPLILIDPVQDSRNATAALSEDKYNILKGAARKFIKNPNKSFFEKKKFNIEELKKTSNKIIILDVIPLRKKEDVAGAKLVKCLEYIKKQLEFNDFKIKDHGFNWDKNAVFYFIMEKDNLETTKKHYGPPIKETLRLEHFKEKWKGHKFFKERNKVYTIVNRKFTKSSAFLKDFIKKDQNIKSMVYSIKLR
nr:CCA tRNA nucleotidyltransferase [Candidatus Woesearchaeota archaeon]